MKVTLEQPIYGSGRIGVAHREFGTMATDINGWTGLSATPAAYTTSYEVADHLGNIRVVGNKNNLNSTVATEIKAFDYYAYGSYLPFHSGAYRYGYQGQYAESDPESQDANGNATYHFDARDFDPVMGRWLTTDPARQFWSSYIGMGNNPIFFKDKDGRIIIVYSQGNSYVYGSNKPIPNDEYIRRTVETLDYLKNCPDAKAVIDNLANKPSKYVSIRNTNEGAFSLSSEIWSKVNWSYKDGAKLIDDYGNETGGYHPPFILLIHELGHVEGAFDGFTDYLNRVKTTIPCYDTYEELRVIQGLEANVAKYFGLQTRTNHMSADENIVGKPAPSGQSQELKLK